MANPNLEGEGYLAGEYPDGITTLYGQPVEADIRIAWRAATQHERDGVVVARTQSNESGEWIVLGLSLDELFDVIGSLEGYEERIVSAVRPVPINFAFTDNGLRPNENYNGVEGSMTVIGGLPPYTFSVTGDVPDGITVNFDRREVTLDGTVDLPDGTYYIEARAESSNGVILDFEIPIYVGFKDIENFMLERRSLFRPTWLNYGAQGLWRPTWVMPKVSESEGGGVIVELSWVDVNGFGNGFRIYKSDYPIDLEALPPPIAELPPLEGKPPQNVSWSDEDVEEGKTYHYVVSTFYGDDEKITEQLEIVASPAPTKIGEFFQGGYYAGNITVDDDTYAVIFAPDDADITRQWKTANSTTPDTLSNVDGWANTLAMTSTESLTLAHPAAAYCRSYDGGGYDDWYLPARNELTLPWTYRADLGDLNMGMNSTYVWSSTQHSSSANTAWLRRFSDGTETNNRKNSQYRVRPVRRIKLAV